MGFNSAFKGLKSVKRNSKDDQPIRSAGRNKNKPTKRVESYMSFGFTNIFVKRTRTALACCLSVNAVP
jgi:hypothetical protein